MPEGILIPKSERPNELVAPAASNNVPSAKANVTLINTTKPTVFGESGTPKTRRPRDSRYRSALVDNQAPTENARAIIKMAIKKDTAVKYQVSTNRFGN